MNPSAYPIFVTTRNALLTGLALLPTLLLATEGPRNRMAQGGGVIYPAWTGSYYANPALEGDPAYVRSDIRVDFDWEDWRPALGVKGESVQAFPLDGYSVRWTGQIIARFDETYTFELESDEQARVKIREEGGEWKVLIDAWEPHNRRIDTAGMALQPGKVYDIVVEYADLTGDAVCSLLWSSPSTPREVIDYVSGNSVHFMYQHVLADLTSFNGVSENSATQGGTKVDEDGWPVQDFSLTLMQGYVHVAGRVRLVFNGLADVSMPGTFLVGEETFSGSLPKGKGYNPATNRTDVLVDLVSLGDGTARTTLAMRNTQRSPDSPIGSGVTHLYVMAPRHVDGTETHEPGDIIHQEARDAFLPIFSFRVQRTGLNEIKKWEERTLPSYSRIMGQKWRADMAYEKLILAANETGRDLHLNYGGSIDEEFMRNLALLAKYGSDGVNPYTKPTPDPVWPPLNPNLRFYLEHGNEMGWSGIQPRDWSREYDQIRRDKTEPVWSILNFDGAITSDHHFGLMRYHAYRTVLMSNIMREVWGDAAMGDRVRVMIFGQYERWFQNGLVQFINDYYNNPEFVDIPRPPSEILWGAGPAVYYGTTNNFAEGDSLLLINGNFEDAPVGPGQAVVRPEMPGWNFSGTAGVVDNRMPRYLAVSGVSAAPETAALDKNKLVGFQFTVGDRDIYIYEIGRLVLPGEKGSATVDILDLNGVNIYGSKHNRANLGNASPGDVLFSAVDHCGWATSDSSRVGVWRLEAGKTYVLVTEAAAGVRMGAQTPLQAGPGLSIDGPVTIDGRLGNRGASGKIAFTTAPGTGFPLPTFRYAFAIDADEGLQLAPSDPLVEPTWPNGGKGKSFVPVFHRSGNRFAFLAGKASMQTTFTVEEAGEYALIFTANSSLDDPSNRAGENPFTIRIGDEIVWDNTVGEGRKPMGGLFQWGTYYTHLEPGTYTMTIESRSNNPRHVVYFYAMHLGNMLDFAGGPTAASFLGAGAATGQTESRFALVAQLTTAMAQNWGLVPYAYEGGTSSGGDWGGGKLEYAHQFKWWHPISKVADNQWAHFWHNYGGANAFYYYPGFEYTQIHRAEEYMPWAASIDRAHTWVLEPMGPVAAPVTFTTQEKHYQSVPGSTWTGWDHPFENERSYEANTPRMATKGLWKSFIFRTPHAGQWRVIAETSRGGQLELSLNDSQAATIASSGQTASLTTFLTKGVHSVRVRVIDGAFDLKSVRIEEAD